MATHAHRGVVGRVVSADPWRRSSGRPHELWRAAGLAGIEQCRAKQSCARTAEVNAPGVQSSRHQRAPTKSCEESFEEFYKSVWDRPLAASKSSGKSPKPPRLPAPPQPEETSNPGSKVVAKSLFQSARKALQKEKRTSAKAEAPPANAQVSGNKKPK